MHKIYIILVYSFVFYSCEISRIDNPLLNGHQYTLWYFNNPYDDDEDYINNWYQKKDKVYKDADFRFTIKNKRNDTLRLQSIDRQHEYIRVDAGITPQK